MVQMKTSQDNSSMKQIKFSSDNYIVRGMIPSTLNFLNKHTIRMCTPLYENTPCELSFLKRLCVINECYTWSVGSTGQFCFLFLI